MDLVQLLQKIRTEKKTKILIFGPPRSGTTLTSFILKKETGYDLIPEGKALAMPKAKREKLFGGDRSFIFHANDAIHYFPNCHTFDMLCILLRRDKEEVTKSAKRINRLGQFNHYYRNFGPHTNYHDNYWHTFNTWQRDHPTQNHIFVLDYSSMKTHSLWLHAKERKGFLVKQVSLEKRSVLHEFDENSASDSK